MAADTPLILLPLTFEAMSAFLACEVIEEFLRSKRFADGGVCFQDFFVPIHMEVIERGVGFYGDGFD